MRILINVHRNGLSSRAGLRRTDPVLPTLLLIALAALAQTPTLLLAAEGGAAPELRGHDVYVDLLDGTGEKSWLETQGVRGFEISATTAGLYVKSTADKGGNQYFLELEPTDDSLCRSPTRSKAPCWLFRQDENGKTGHLQPLDPMTASLPLVRDDGKPLGQFTIDQAKGTLVFHAADAHGALRPEQIQLVVGYVENPGPPRSRIIKSRLTATGAKGGTLDGAYTVTDGQPDPLPAQRKAFDEVDMTHGKHYVRSWDTPGRDFFRELNAHDGVWLGPANPPPTTATGALP